MPNESIGSEMPEALPDKEATLLISAAAAAAARMPPKSCWRWGIRDVYDFGGVIDWPYELVKEG